LKVNLWMWHDLALASVLRHTRWEARGKRQLSIGTLFWKPYWLSRSWSE